MKKYFFSLSTVLLFTLSNSLHSQYTSWENISNQIPGDSLNYLSDVSVPSRWIGFIASKSNSEIYRSIFSTGIWEVLQTPSPLTAFYILDYDYGFICGTDSNVYQTINAGESWNYLGSIGEYINDINLGYDIYNSIGYVCGNNGVIGKIEGTSLIVIQSGIATDFIRISSPTIDRVWLVGDSSVYYYNGSSFNNQFTSSVKLNSVYFVNEFYGWVVGDSGYIAKTSDGGNSWIQKQNPDILKRNLNDIYLISFFGFAVGDNGLILNTNNSGETWTLDTVQLTTNNLVSVHISGGGSEWGPGLAVGDNKTVLSYPIVVSVNDNQKLLDHFYLYQNFPNPFNPSTKIKYSIPLVETHRDASLFVTLKVYDILGNEIATLVDEEKPAGTYEIEFNVTSTKGGLPSGIYFYQLIAGEFINTKKMSLLK